MKNYTIEFILKVDGKLQQQIICVEAKNKKDAFSKAKIKLYIPRYFQSIDHYEFI